MKKRRGVFGHTYRSSCGGKKKKKKGTDWGKTDREKNSRSRPASYIPSFSPNPHLFFAQFSLCPPFLFFFFFFLLFSFCRLFTIGLTPCCIRRHIYIRPCIYSTNELKIKNREIGPSCWAIQTTTSIVSLSVKLPVWWVSRLFACTVYKSVLRIHTRYIWQSSYTYAAHSSLLWYFVFFLVSCRWWRTFILNDQPNIF